MHSRPTSNTTKTTPRCYSHASKAMGYLPSISPTVEVKLSACLKLHFAPNMHFFLVEHRSNLAFLKTGLWKRFKPRMTTELRQGEDLNDYNKNSFCDKAIGAHFERFIQFCFRAVSNLQCLSEMKAACKLVSTCVYFSSRIVFRESVG